MTDHWTEQKHPEYKRMIRKWQRASVHYRGDIDELRTDAYLVQRKAGEHIEQFRERMKLADYTPLLATVVDAYAGRLQEAEKKIERRFQLEEQSEGLGSIRDPESIAFRYWHNVNGRGLNYLPMLYDVITTGIVKKWVYGLVEGVVRDESGDVIQEPILRIIDPESVYDWREDRTGRLTEVKVYHTFNKRESIREESQVVDRYTVYDSEGFEVWEREDDKADPMLINSERYGQTFYNSSDRSDGDLILPIFRVELPMSRYVADMLAAKNGVYFNQESERDNKLRICNTPKLQIVADDKETRDAIEDQLKKGSNILWISSQSTRDHEYKEPAGDSVTASNETIELKRNGFMFSAFREFENSVRGSQVTATEAAQTAAMGEHSFLNTLCAFADEFEMESWKRIEQREFPERPDLWGQFFVERKCDFKPLDEEGEAERLIRTFFGHGTIPAGEQGRINAALRALELLDMEHDPDEVAEDVRARADREAQAGQVPSPSEMLRRRAARLNGGEE